MSFFHQVVIAALAISEWGILWGIFCGLLLIVGTHIADKLRNY